MNLFFRNDIKFNIISIIILINNRFKYKMSIYIIMKTFTKKNDEISVYNQKEYNKSHYEKNKDKILNNKYMCICCNKSVNQRNKSNHNKTLKHKLYEQLINNQQ